MATTSSPSPHPGCPSPALRLVPFAYVADVEASLAFYAHLGFHATRVERSADGRFEWAWAQAAAPADGDHPAALMFGRSCEPIVTGAQGVFFCMHCADAAALRSHLLTVGLRDGGVRTGSPGAPRAPNTVFAMVHPAYMPAGEFHIHDPDGYSILVGQIDKERAPPMPPPVVRAVAPFLAAKDLSAVVAFYTTHLGFKAVTLHPPEKPTLAILDSIDPATDARLATLMFDSSLWPGEPAMTGQINLDLDPQGNGPSRVLALLARMGAAARIEWGPEVYGYGRRECSIKDPSGYSVVLSEQTDDPVECKE